MSRFVTLLAVAEILGASSGNGGTSSTTAGDILFALEVPDALPKESFHFDDFLEIDGVVGLGDGREGTGGTEALTRESGGKAMPEEEYCRARTSGAGDICAAPGWRDVREISRARA